MSQSFSKSDFFFDLPESLIAQKPTENRTDSRLLVMNNEQLEDRAFNNILDYIEPNDCLIFNNTKVIPARLFGKKTSGGKVELLIERIVDESVFLSHVKSSNAPKPGSVLEIESAFKVEVIGRDGALFVLKVIDDTSTALSLIEANGHMPLPPYIQREDNDQDQERYQTVYSSEPGAVAAPTAGLHFDESMLEAIQAKGALIGFVTLHVGAGTFKPVQVDNISDHKMHSEWIEVLPETVELIEQTKCKGGKVFAVGTTSIRSLESAATINGGTLKPYTGETDIFITPGYDFKVIDVLLTNFHLPESTLIMLVSALAGYNNTMNAYHHAVQNSYRFFSYGDAMLVFPNKEI